MIKSPIVRRTALVTGATRGIGRSICAQLAADGFDVIGTGRGDIAQDAAYDHHLSVDFTNEASFDAFIRSVREIPISVLVNNAGINRISPFESITDDDFDSVQLVNVRRPFQLCRAVLPRMKEAGWGRIVNISSIFGKISRAQRASYSTSKFGLDGMTVALAAEVGKYNVLANCVAPGFVDTELTRRVLGDAGIAELVGQVPIGRLAQPEEIAFLVSWLVSDKNSYVTGQNIAIDGGFTRV